MPEGHMTGRRRWSGWTVGALLLVVPAGASAADLTPTTTADVVAQDGACSLREAVDAANADAPSGPATGECPAGSGADRILLAPAEYRLTLHGGSEDANARGDLDVTSAITFVGV